MDRTTAIRQSLARIQWLRATGPPTLEYLRWRDGAEEVLRDLLGAAHPLLQDFLAAVGEREAVDAEGLQVDGPHGMRPRLARAEAVLRQVLGEEP